jgi:hypothetical protein
MFAWRWLLLGGTCLGAMVVASITAGTGEWTQTREWAEARSAELARERRLLPVPVLFGEPIAGDPVAAYAAAAEVVQRLPSTVTAQLQPLLADTAAWPVATADHELVATLTPAVTALRAAVRHTRAATSPAWPSGAELPAPDAVLLLDGVRTLLVFARAHAIDAEGCEAALAAVALGLMAMTGPTLIDQVVGATSVAMTMDSIDDARLAALPPALLQSLADALARADAAFVVPTHLPAAIACSLVDFLQTAVDVEPLDLGMASALVAWEHGFSVRLSGMARAAELVAQVRCFEAESPAAEPWSARRTRLVALENGDRQRNPDLHWPWLGSIVDGEEGCRRAQVKLRLLRLAAAVRRGGDVPRLDDPLLGGTFVIERSADAVVVRGGGEQRTVARP